MARRSALKSSAFRETTRAVFHPRVSNSRESPHLRNVPNCASRPIWNFCRNENMHRYREKRMGESTMSAALRPVDFQCSGDPAHIVWLRRDTNTYTKTLSCKWPFEFLDAGATAKDSLARESLPFSRPNFHTVFRMPSPTYCSYLTMPWFTFKPKLSSDCMIGFLLNAWLWIFSVKIRERSRANAREWSKPACSPRTDEKRRGDVRNCTGDLWLGPQTAKGLQGTEISLENGKGHRPSWT
jgi:hypothetical protein